MQINDCEIKPCANLRGANLQEAYLRRTVLRWADLQGADLQGAHLREADLREADLQGADLQGADLQEAYLRRTVLQGANLRGANLPKTDFVLQCPWSICHIQRANIRIGCKYHTTKEWKNFTDKEINQMHPQALVWWKQWKPVVMAAARACKPYPKR